MPTVTVASSLNWKNEQFWNHYCRVEVFLIQCRLDDANAHIESAKLCADDMYSLCCITDLQAAALAIQDRFEGSMRSLRLQRSWRSTGSLSNLLRERATYLPFG